MRWRRDHPSIIVGDVLAAIGAFGIVAMLTGLTDRIGREPDLREVHGPFTVVTHHDSDDHYTVSHRGEPLILAGRAGMFGDQTATYVGFNAVVTWSDTTALVVHVGDPNNTGFYYLVHEVAGSAVTGHLGESHGGVAAGWLEAPADSGTIRNTTLHRGALGPGRWLLLGDGVVLDTRRLQAFPLPAPAGVYLTPFRGSLGMSPDQRSFVRLGSDGDNAPRLIVFDVLAGTVTTQPIDAEATAYPGWEALPLDWLDRHFAWRRGEDGHHRLVARETDAAAVPEATP